MFGIGTPELILIFFVALIILGPTKLPAIARSIGRGLRELQRTLHRLEHETHFDPDNAGPPDDEAESPQDATDNTAVVPPGRPQNDPPYPDNHSDQNSSDDKP